MLKATASDGKIVILHNMREYCIKVGGENIVSSQKSRDIALWEGVIEDLEESDFITDVDNKREAFKVTSKGYKYAEKIRSSKDK